MARRGDGGIVYLVGAGPGDPGLITVRGLRALRASDVVVYDRLVHPDLLKEAPAAAVRIYAGKQAGRRATTQEAINTLLVAHARRGRTVTRLKGGDPFVFGRGGEECEALRAAGIRFEVVPGVTSAIAVPAYAGIPVTDRRYASAFTVVTGHECGTPSDLDWGALARLPVLVILMGHRALPEITRRLLKHGVRPETPAVVVSNGTTPHQQTAAGTLATISPLARTAGLESPSVLIVGEVARLHETLHWFEPGVDGKTEVWNPAGHALTGRPKPSTISGIPT